MIAATILFVIIQTAFDVWLLFQLRDLTNRDIKIMNSISSLLDAFLKSERNRGEMIKNFLKEKRNEH